MGERLPNLQQLQRYLYYVNSLVTEPQCDSVGARRSMGSYSSYRTNYVVECIDGHDFINVDVIDLKFESNIAEEM